MVNIIFLCLGAVAAVVIILMIALVVVVVKLRKEVKYLQDDSKNLWAELSSKEAIIQRNLEESVRDLNSSIVDVKQACTCYTDSRIDKIVSKSK